MRIFVTGGTGAIGVPAVRALVAAGHEVSATARSDERARELEARGAAPVRVSIFDRDELATAMAGHDVVVNLATALPSMSGFLRSSAWHDNQRIRTEGSAALVDAAMRAGVGRFVQESVSMLYADRGDAWIDETCPTDRYPIASGNHAAEASAERFSGSGADGVVLRFGWFYGPGATHSEQLLALARRHVCVQVGRPDGYVSSIHVDDGGRAVAAAVGLLAGVYNVVDDEPLTKRAYADALANAAGAKAWLRVPARVAVLLRDRSTSLTRSTRVRNAKLREATDWSPRYPSAREGWLATAASVGEPRRG